MPVAFAVYLSYWIANLIVVLIWSLLIDYLYIEWFIFAGIAFALCAITWRMVETNQTDDTTMGDPHFSESFFDVMET